MKCECEYADGPVKFLASVGDRFIAGAVRCEACTKCGAPSPSGDLAVHAIAAELLGAYPDKVTYENPVRS